MSASLTDALTCGESRSLRLMNPPLELLDDELLDEVVEDEPELVQELLKPSPDPSVFLRGASRILRELTRYKNHGRALATRRAEH